MGQKTALVTGCSGFIGHALSQRLLNEGWKVVGIDSLTDYYDVALKKQRQTMLEQNPDFSVLNAEIQTPGVMKQLFQDHQPEFVIHLAGQVGVRYSLVNPRSYLEGNIIGTFEILEAARENPPKHMLFASTSSAYGANLEMPYLETQKTDHQMSFYAATKKSTESMAHSYAHLFNIPVTMFRFFTVYGPWGRPDMALFKFTKAILGGEPIDVYNYGDMKRDFTFIDDLVTGIRLLMDAIPVRPADGVVPPGDSLSPVAPHRVVNIGNTKAVQLTEFIEAIEAATGLSATRNLMPMQPGDVPATWANAELLQSLTGYTPKTSVQDGVKAFVEWYQEFYQPRGNT